MDSTVQTADGENVEIIMGCYGLGVSRTMAAAVEAHHDEDGIVWPMSIAPYEAVIIVGNLKDESQVAAAEALHVALTEKGIEALYDDRDERPGVKFKDADLIGYPVRIVVGRTLAEGSVEVVLRRDKMAAQQIPLVDIVDYVANLVASEKAA